MRLSVALLRQRHPNDPAAFFSSLPGSHAPAVRCSIICFVSTLVKVQASQAVLIAELVGAGMTVNADSTDGLIVERNFAKIAYVFDSDDGMLMTQLKTA